MSDDPYWKDVNRWLRYDDEDEDFDIANDPLLTHLNDIDILGLGDSYDDPRIDVLAMAYIDLRREKLYGLGPH